MSRSPPDAISHGKTGIPGKILPRCQFYYTQDHPTSAYWGRAGDKWLLPTTGRKSRGFIYKTSIKQCRGEKTCLPSNESCSWSWPCAASPCWWRQRMPNKLPTTIPIRNRSWARSITIATTKATTWPGRQVLAGINTSRISTFPIGRLLQRTSSRTGSLAGKRSQ